MFDEIKELSKRIRFDLFRITALLYIIFLVFYLVDVVNGLQFLKHLYNFSNNQVVHTIGIISLLFSLIRIFKSSASRKYFIKKIKFLFSNYESDISSLDSFSLGEMEVQNTLEAFTKDAHEVYIFGGNMDFLREDYHIKNDQYEELLRLGKKCKILISEGYNIEIDRLKNLSDSGVKIRAYPKERSNYTLRGRLKKNDLGNYANLYLKKEENYIFQSIQSQYISSMLFKEFSDMYEKGTNPFVKYIMFDVGGVWCEGKMESFLEKVYDATGVLIEDKPGNYLLLSEKLNLSTPYSILNYVEEQIGRELTEEESGSIKLAWNNNWVINTHMKEFAAELESNGYKIIIHSNCDEENGDKYQLRNYFNDYQLFMSYKMNLLKPTPEFYIHILNSLECKPYECIFIDDSIENINRAEQLGFIGLKVSIHSEPEEKVKLLRKKMKELAIKLDHE